MVVSVSHDACVHLGSGADGDAHARLCTKIFIYLNINIYSQLDIYLFTF